MASRVMTLFLPVELACPRPASSSPGVQAPHSLGLRDLMGMDGPGARWASFRLRPVFGPIQPCAPFPRPASGFPRAGGEWGPDPEVLASGYRTWGLSRLKCFLSPRPPRLPTYVNGLSKSHRFTQWFQPGLPGPRGCEKRGRGSCLELRQGLWHGREWGQSEMLPGWGWGRETVPVWERGSSLGGSRGTSEELSRVERKQGALLAASAFSASLRLPGLLGLGFVAPTPWSPSAPHLSSLPSSLLRSPLTPFSSSCIFLSSSAHFSPVSVSFPCSPDSHPPLSNYASFCLSNPSSLPSLLPPPQRGRL